MAVYTRFSDSELDLFLQNYALGTVTDLSEIEQGVENTNYFLTTQTGKYVLTIYEKRVNIDDLPYFLSFSEYLNSRNIATPSPVKNIYGHSFTDFMGKKAAIIHFLNGHNLTIPNLLQCVSAGEFVAKMHNAQTGFAMTRPNDLSPLGSLWELYKKIENLLQEQLPHFYPLVALEVLYLQKNYPTNLTIGNIHGDIFPDNMFFDNDNAIGIIDFYFSCTDFLAYDLAIVLCAWCFDKGQFNAHKFYALLKAYQRIRILSADEINNLPILMRGATMRFFLTRSHDVLFHDKNALVIPKNPQEYYDILVFLQNFTPEKICNNDR
jgi:homoserine kinase type II